MTVEKVEINAANVRELFKSPEVNALLSEHAAKKTASCNSAGSAHLHSPMDRPLYEFEIRELNNVNVATIHATTKAAAAINRKYNILTW